jgi:hypothetical protein
MTYPTYAAGDILTAADMNALGMYLVKSDTIGSAVASVSVTNAFSADYDRYKIVVSGTGTGSTIMSLRLTLGSTSTGYYAAYLTFTYDGGIGAAGAVGDNNAASWSVAGRASATGIAFDVDLINPFLAARTSVAGNRGDIETAAGASMATFSGFLANTTSFTGFTITCSTGTLTGGKIRVYGYKV